MTPQSLLRELTRLTDIINDEKADNTAGRKEALRYEVLPKVLVDNVEIIKKALREMVERSEAVTTNTQTQQELFG